ncbi:hypothetical protein [Nostoc sp. FACHB-892]|uniref:hypothetical protein n=1 Tax=Nostoc sp. FACHB-892 TaxID=2692843 RepID=UPI001687F56B|nr:hypothetical protein [Nostoc sp. FACHB-892]
MFCCNGYTNLVRISQLFICHPVNVFVGGGEVTLLSGGMAAVRCFFSLPVNNTN